MIGAAILGILAGFLARLLVPGRQDIGFLMTVVLGLAGAAVGYVIFTLLLGIGDTMCSTSAACPARDRLGHPARIYIKFVAPGDAARSGSSHGGRPRGPPA